MEEPKSSYAIIILAAGNSSRLGEPKQLLRYHNKSLIRHVAEEALDATSSPVFVITGSNSDLIESELAGTKVQFIYNSDWQEGMASSIRCGIQKLMSTNNAGNGAIFAVSDQPFVTAKLFKDLITEAENHNASIVASSYENTIGTPVLFDQKYFDSLRSLKGSEGAKKLLKQFQGDVKTVPFPLGGVDIDTQEDYQNLLKQ